MADILEAIPQAQPAPLSDEWKASTRPSLWQQVALGVIMVISLFMNFYQLGQNGFGNLYYAAGVRSMLDNWRNFFFISFDPGGFVTIDKPPLGFWLQVLSAKLFGFTAFSVYLPQALAGVLSVLLLYHLVRRHFGVIAGLLAALALALSPISVVTNRNNTIDSTLALVLLLGAWAVMRAAETGRLRWLLLCAVAVGLGFNIKMLEAYLVVPAYGLLYLLAAPRSIWKRIGHLAVAGLLLLVLSLSWLVAVDSTPASLRPYVGSSQNNSEISLALGYNGISRLLGQFGFGGQSGQAGQANTNRDSSNQSANVTGQQPSQGPGGSGSNGVFNTGTPGPLRLFNEPLGGQIAWLLPLAILAMLALAWQRRPRLQHDPRQQSLVLWGVWLLTMGVFFSVAGFFHEYYLTEMAPAIAALVGIGIVTMWRDYRRAGWRGWLLPLALIVTALEQIHILSSYPAWGQWLIPLIAACCLLGAVTLIVLRLPWLARFERIRMQVPVTALSVAFLVLMIAPMIWAGIPVIQNVSEQLPIAGPTQQGSFGFGARGSAGGSSNSANANSALIRYLEAHQGKATYLVATASSNTADEIILATNKPVMALGGFSGSDPILTTTQLATLVKNGTVRFFLLGSFGPGQGVGQQSPPSFSGGTFPEPPNGGFGGGGGRFGGGSQSSLTSWVTQHCSVVSSSQLQSTANQLYDCATSS